MVCVNQSSREIDKLSGNKRFYPFCSLVLGVLLVSPRLRAICQQPTEDGCRTPKGANKSPD
jgi:hypothetical protein